MIKSLKSLRSVLVWAAAALFCIAALSFQSSAAVVGTLPAKEFKMGPGDHYDEQGNVVSVSGELLMKADGTIVKVPTTTDASTAKSDASAAIISSTPEQTKTAAAQKPANATAASAKAEKNYTSSEVNGTTYFSFEGKTYKTGAYCGVHKLSGYSGEETGSAKTTSGKTATARHTLAASSQFPLGTVIIIKGTEGPHKSAYDGMYVVEDRGGYYIETEGWLDIYFDTAAEAAATSDDGWNYAEAWIAEPVK